MLPDADPKANRWISIRIGLIGLLFAAGFGTVAWRAVQLQVVQRDVLSAEARNQYVRQVVMAPRRGVIADRSGVMLAGSADAESVFIDPKELEEKSEPGTRPLLALARALGLDPKVLRARVDRGPPRFAWVRRRVSGAEAARSGPRSATCAPGTPTSRAAPSAAPAPAAARPERGSAGVGR